VNSFKVALQVILVVVINWVS